MATQEQKPQPDPLACFKHALAKYRESVDTFEKGWRETYWGSETWRQRDHERRIAAEELWVSGVGGFFDLLETNYKAQEQLVAEQVRLARRTTRATVAMAIIAGAAIVAAILGPKFWREPAPLAPQIIYVQAPPMPTAPIDAGR
jgi:hypothetical protein